MGKSFLAAVLAHHLCKQGHSVRYIKTADLVLELKLAKGDGSYPKLRKQLAAYDLLVLDEWLRDPLSVFEAREVLDILDERFRKASCSICHANAHRTMALTNSRPHPGRCHP